MSVLKTDLVHADIVIQLHHSTSTHQMCLGRVVFVLVQPTGNRRSNFLSFRVSGGTQEREREQELQRDAKEVEAQ
jgi:hypothetical protein